MDANAQLPPDFDEQIVASNSMIPAAAEMSKILDAFASWAAGGYAAALALFLSNSDAHRWIGQDAITKLGRIFAAVLILTTMQKYLATAINGVSVSYSLGAKAAKDQMEARGKEFRFDVTVFASIVASTLWRLPRWLTKLSAKRVTQGDFSRELRFAARLIQIQGAMVFVTAVLLIVAAISVAWR